MQSAVRTFPYGAAPMGRILWTALLIGALAWGVPAQAAGKSIKLASTTSTENSGLFAYLLPQFEAKTGIKVHVIAVGTGQALRIARNGDADVLLVHHRPSEERFVRNGYGIRRHDVMYNDFVVVGPTADPARVAGTRGVLPALRRIAASRSRFLSRGDDSGTHKRERDLWRRAGIPIVPSTSRWYRETGSGMGATLNTAVAMKAYTLADRATWLSFSNKTGMALFVEGDKRLFNQYGVIVVDPVRHPSVRARDARVFVQWLTGPQGQTAIGKFRVGGRQVFYPNAGKKQW